MKLYLDDIRDTPDGWQRVFTSAECISVLETGLVTELSLDHDLCEEHYTSQEASDEWTCSLDARTGYAVVVWLENKVRQDPSFVMPVVHLHTMNPVGREHMAAGLRQIEEYLRDRQENGS